MPVGTRTRGGGDSMPTVVLGYVPKPEGEAALAASISEARLRQADLVVVNAHRAHHGDTESSGLERRARRRARPASRLRESSSTSATPRPASRPPRTSSHRRGGGCRADRHRSAAAYPRRQADPGQQRPAHPARRPLPGPGGQVRLSDLRAAQVADEYAARDGSR